MPASMACWLRRELTRFQLPGSEGRLVNALGDEGAAFQGNAWAVNFRVKKFAIFYWGARGNGFEILTQWFTPWPNAHFSAVF